MMVHLVVIAIKERQKTRLCPRRTLDTPESNIVTRPLDVSQVPQQLLGDNQNI